MRSTVPPVAPSAVPVPVPVLQWMGRIPPVMPTYRLINVGIAACCVYCVSTVRPQPSLVPAFGPDLVPIDPTPAPPSAAAATTYEVESHRS